MYLSLIADYSDMGFLMQLSDEVAFFCTDRAFPFAIVYFNVR